MYFAHTSNMPKLRCIVQLIIIKAGSFERWTNMIKYPPFSILFIKRNLSMRNKITAPFYVIPRSSSIFPKRNLRKSYKNSRGTKSNLRAL